MKKGERKRIKPDRIGLYLGQLRQRKNITLVQLSEGLCGTDYLSRIETGQREAEKRLFCREELMELRVHILQSFGTRRGFVYAVYGGTGNLITGVVTFSPAVKITS